jgi:hypothetical protein
VQKIPTFILYSKDHKLHNFKCHQILSRKYVVACIGDLRSEQHLDIPDSRSTARVARQNYSEPPCNLLATRRSTQQKNTAPTGHFHLKTRADQLAKGKTTRNRPMQNSKVTMLLLARTLHVICNNKKAPKISATLPQDPASTEFSNRTQHLKSRLHQP